MNANDKSSSYAFLSILRLVLNKKTIDRNYTKFVLGITFLWVITSLQFTDSNKEQVIFMIKAHSWSWVSISLNPKGSRCGFETKLFLKNSANFSSAEKSTLWSKCVARQTFSLKTFSKLFLEEEPKMTVSQGKDITLC